jgi:hypothetical protein
MLGKVLGGHPNIMDEVKIILGHEGQGWQRFKDLFKKCEFNKRHSRVTHVVSLRKKTPVYIFLNNKFGGQVGVRTKEP